MVSGHSTIPEITRAMINYYSDKKEFTFSEFKGAAKLYKLFSNLRGTQVMTWETIDKMIKLAQRLMGEAGY